jgi:hypothetical protein
MKPTLLKLLPHLFRFIERVGLILPRRFFTPASEYKSVPPGSKLDSLFPSVSDFPRMVESIRHPKKRGRSISIGPQSAADAYETLAYRERRRRESISSNRSLNSKPSKPELTGNSNGADDASSANAQTSGVQKPALHEFEKMMGEGKVFTTVNNEGNEEMYIGREDELGEKEVFSQLVKPRVRYDVEVVTKLVVYTGWYPQL